MDGVQIIQLPKITDPRGNLSIIEQLKQIPFEIKRAHWVYDVPGGVDRVGHAYRKTEEFIVALSGSFDVVIDDGVVKTTYPLNRSYFGLYVPGGMWRTMTNFSTNALALVLSSTSYDEKDYVSDYGEYKEWKKDASKVPTVTDAKTSVHMNAPVPGHLVSEGKDVFDCSLCELNRIHDPEGNLTYMYENVHVPFPINRVFYTYDIPGGEDRGAPGDRDNFEGEQAHPCPAHRGRNRHRGHLPRDQRGILPGGIRDPGGDPGGECLPAHPALLRPADGGIGQEGS